MTEATFELQIKYNENPHRTQSVRVDCDLDEAFRKANAIYYSDNLGLIRTVRVHSLKGKFLGAVKRVNLKSPCLSFQEGDSNDG